MILGALLSTTAKGMSFVRSSDNGSGRKPERRGCHLRPTTTRIRLLRRLVRSALRERGRKLVVSLDRLGDPCRLGRPDTVARSPCAGVRVDAHAIVSPGQG